MMRKLAIAAIALFAGVYFAVPAILDGIEARQMQSWATTPATIQSWDTRFNPLTFGNRNRIATIVYTYDYNGQTYTGNGLSPSPQRYNETYSWTVRASRDYPIGSTQPVYVDPNDPARSYLETVDSLDVLLPLVIGAGMLLFGFAVLIRTLRD
jgi:hypothetical protein